MSALLTEKHVSSFSELIDFLSEFGNEGGETIYRGQPDASLPLLPSAWRKGSKVEELMKRFFLGSVGSNYADREAEIIPDANPGKVENLKKLEAWLDAEMLFVSDFCKRCDLAALPVPGMASPYRDFKISFHPYANVPAFNFRPAFALAQHHGVPTRLLDFSDNPLVASFFAADQACQKMTLMNVESRFAVWVCQRLYEQIDERIQRFKNGNDSMVMRVLRSQIKNVAAQDGVFLWATGGANRFYIDNGRWPNLDEMLDGWRLTKVTAPVSIRDDLMKRLSTFGINESRLKPSYDAVAKVTLRQL